MSAVEYLKPLMPVARISRAMDMPRSTIYYRRSERTEKSKPRISSAIGDQIIRIAGERTTYGYRRIMKRRNLKIPENINMLWETDIHYVSTSRDGMAFQKA